MGKAIEYPDGLSGDEFLTFGYLRAVYSLNTFYGHRIKPEGYFKTNNETICAAAIERGESIVDMHKSGADALYCALLSDPRTDRSVFLKTVELHIPF